MRIRIAFGALALPLLIAGCGVPPELRPSPGVPVPTPTASPAPRPTVAPGFTLSPSGRPTTPAPFPEVTSVDCGGKPTGAQVIALVKRTTTIVSESDKPTVLKGPLCSGSWQYTVLTIPNRDPLQVVSKGDPGTLVLVTAGTDVCTVEVRNYSPPGLRIEAAC